MAASQPAGRLHAPLSVHDALRRGQPDEAVRALREAKEAAERIGRTAHYVKRLRRIEGQVRGLQKMVEEDRYCADIMTQISSVHEALRGVSRELMRNHLKHCASAAIRASEEEAEAMYDELIDLMGKGLR